MVKVFVCCTLCNKCILNPWKCSSVIFLFYVFKHMNGYYSFDMFLNFIFKNHVGDSECVVQLWKRS